MKKTPLIVSAIGLGFLSQSAFAAPFDFKVGVASDYVYRGISQSGEDPAVQASIQFHPSKGWFVRGFASEVESRFGGNMELEFAGGYQSKLNKDFSYKGELVYSVYTDEENGDSDYIEGNFSLSYKKFFTALIGHTNDYYGTSDAGTYFEGRFHLPLHDVIKTDVYAGNYSLDDSAGESYSVFGVDAWTHIGEIKFKLSFSDTDLEGTDIADSRIFVNASYQF